MPEKVKHKCMGFFAAFIPRWIPNRVTLFFYDLLSRRGRLEKLPAPENPPVDGKPDRLKYIEDQRNRPGERFGRSTVDRAGCEVIALYNALGFLSGHERIPFPALVHVFERHGMALGGLWGTSPAAIRRSLKKSGYPVRFATKRQRMAELMDASECAILSYYNDGADVMRGVHTICVTRSTEGLKAHNLTEDGRVRGPFADLETLLHAAGPRASGLCLISVGKPQEPGDPGPLS